MGPVKSRAIILRTYRLGETSKVVVCYTRDYGKVRLVAKGARKGGGRLGGALEPMLVSGVVFYLRRGRDLFLVSQATVERSWRSLRADVVRMAYAGAMLELVEAMVPDLEPDPELFDVAEAALDAADSALEHDLDLVLWTFELDLARALGYTPHLDRCVVCGKEPADGATFSARSGGVVCGDCAGRAPGGTPLSDGAVRLLAKMGRGDGGDGAELTPALRDEVGGCLVAFLEEHLGQELKLKSLGFLAQIRRTEQVSRESE